MKTVEEFLGMFDKNLKPPPRCPVCGRGGGCAYDPDSRFWGCWCTGTVVRFRNWIHPDAMSPDIEYLRWRYLNRGFGWSWYRPWNSPVIVLGEN